MSAKITPSRTRQLHQKIHTHTLEVEEEQNKITYETLVFVVTRQVLSFVYTKQNTILKEKRD